MGLVLIVTAILMGLKQAGMLDLLGSGNEATALTGLKLIIGVIGNFLLGALMTIGVGLYAPCMALVYMLVKSACCFSYYDGFLRRIDARCFR